MCIVQEDTRAEKARDFVGKGTLWEGIRRVRGPRRTAQPRGSLSRALCDGLSF